MRVRKGYTYLVNPQKFLLGIHPDQIGSSYSKIGARPLAIVGLTITALSTFEFSELTSLTTFPHLMLLYTVRSFGMSMIMMSVQTEGLNQLPPRLGSHGTAMSNTMRQVAGSIGTALLVTVMSTRTTVHIESSVLL